MARVHYIFVNANETPAAEHFPAPVITTADMTDNRDFLAHVAPGMLVEVVFPDEGLACGNTEVFTVQNVSGVRMEVISVSGVRFGICFYGTAPSGPASLTFGRAGVAMRPNTIWAVRTVAYTPR